MRVGVVILAAGKGTRMKSDLPKVLHEVCGRTLLDWALSETALLASQSTVVVVGHQADTVTETCPDDVTAVVQEPQLGTGHAVQVGLAALDPSVDTVVVLPGDMPLIRPSSLRTLVDSHASAGSAATIMSVNLDDPTGYGRIVRSDGSVSAIVEHRDANDEELSIREVNTSVYVFDRQQLVDALTRVTTDNDQGEYYLTDVVGILVEAGASVEAVSVPEDEGLGVNDHSQLATATAEIVARINHHWMVEGVSITDPARTIIEPSVALAPGSTIHPDTWLKGETSVASGAVVGPQVDAVDSSIGTGATVRYAVMHEATIGDRAIVGPYTYLRPGAVLEEGAKAGAFVEIKGSTVGKGSKVPHLSYIGDTDIGEKSNIGAATVTVNYDGFRKHRTKIGSRVRIGSDTMLIAPVEVGDDAATGAGSVITKDVPDGALGIARSDQRNIDGYAEKRRKRAEEETD